MNENLAALDLKAKTKETQIELCAKSAPIIEQLRNRVEWSPDRVEILLDGLRHLPILPEICDYASANFGKFNVEVGYALDRFSPTDLTESRSQNYILRVAEICRRYKNFDRLIMHLVGGAVVLEKDTGYTLGHRVLPQKEVVLQECRDFLTRLDPVGEFMALENTYPVDFSTNGIAVYPIGKIHEDFVGLPRVLDTAHLAISAATYAETDKAGGAENYGIYTLSEGWVPVYLGLNGSPERRLGEVAKSGGLTEAIVEEISHGSGNVMEIHFCANYDSERRQKDGAGFEDNAAIDLRRIFHVISSSQGLAEKVTLIPEIKEHDENYLEAPRQRKMFMELKILLGK